MRKRKKRHTCVRKQVSYESASNTGSAEGKGVRCTSAQDARADTHRVKEHQKDTATRKGHNSGQEQQTHKQAHSAVPIWAAVTFTKPHLLHGLQIIEKKQV